MGLQRHKCDNWPPKVQYILKTSEHFLSPKFHKFFNNLGCILSVSCLIGLCFFSRVLEVPHFVYFMSDWPLKFFLSSRVLKVPYFSATKREHKLDICLIMCFAAAKWDLKLDIRLIMYFAAAKREHNLDISLILHFAVAK